MTIQSRISATILLLKEYLEKHLELTGKVISHDFHILKANKYVNHKGVCMKETISKELWDTLRVTSRKIETEMDPLERKRTGSYYTDLKLTDIMMQELISALDLNKKRICDYTFFEPCVGTGNFVFSYLKAVKPFVNQDEALTLLDNIYVSDINESALKQYKSSLQVFALECWNIILDDKYFNAHIGTGLLIDVTAEKLEYIPLNRVFDKKIVKKGFDIVATNPPYKNLKAEKGHYSHEEDYEIDKKKYSSISKIVSKTFKYATVGVLNLYKLFVEEIIDRYANEDAFVSLLIPSSILSDKTCERLRTHILCDSSLLSVKVISEGSGYIDAQQALCTMLISKGDPIDTVRITKDYCKNPNEIACVQLKDILNENTGNSIIAVSEREYETLRKLRTFPVVKNLDFIMNFRGELDLTAGKGFITRTQTEYPLIRGRNIGFYNLIDSAESDSVLSEFVESTKKKKYIDKERIICQQIANMNKERRVTFAYIPAGYVLGNSCNFISVGTNDYGLDIFALLGLFNSKCINWLFKLTSSNNHVNNYEIDSFPVPINSNLLCKISHKVQELLQSNNEKLIEEIEELSMKAYGLSEKEGENKMDFNKFVVEYLLAIRHILPNLSEENANQILLGKLKIDVFLDGLDKFNVNVAKGITSKYISLNKGYLLNHTTFKLSDLDLEMIKSVPQGGSWKDIPMETVVKSKRLKRITETGGRTTLYGRIDYDKPSYTITTYFNRPGNGTYVHPMHDRVLSVREAARFQTFPDNYYFFGNKTQLLKQVGNAVPTLLAYQIAREIKIKTGCSKSIDLFCGAGGMTAGFKAAGISSLLSNDIEESACTTLKINNPEIPVLCGDITAVETKDIIEKAALEGQADIICGGPPCQGFSMAGFRADDDPRNQLFREFVAIVKRVNPKVIVFENVEGLLSYQGGKTYREVHQLFSELGYNTEGRTLMANDYGVPQKRKRVIIICTKNDLSIMPRELFPSAITVEDERQVTARDTIVDLENVECSETAQYIDCEESDILQFFKGKISYEEYVLKKTPSPKVKSYMQSHMEEEFGQLTLDFV